PQEPRATRSTSAPFRPSRWLLTRLYWPKLRPLPPSTRSTPRFLPSRRRPMPKWMRKAIKQQVLTLEEASELYLLVSNSDSAEVEIPSRLHPAVERVWLWETPTLNQLPI